MSSPSPGGRPTATPPGEGAVGRIPATALGFQPVVNGVDFLDSAITHLLTPHDARSVKYAVLHLQAAIEILVKVRLQRESWEQVFDEPEGADINKLTQGKFRSVSLPTALSRLREHAGIELAKTELRALDRLNDERNKLQHFGSTSNHDVVNTRAGNALEVLAEFIVKHMVPGAPEDEAGALEDAQELIRQALAEIATVTAARLTRLGPELDRWPSIVVACPDCAQLALPFGPEDETSCLFCGRAWWEEYGWEVAEQYAENILGDSRHEAAQGTGGWSVSACPNCREEAFVDVTTRARPNDPTDVCFQCGFIADGPLGSCGDCGGTTLDPDATLCPGCLSYLLSKD